MPYYPGMAHPKADPTLRVPPEPMEPTNPAERERVLVEAEADIEAGQGTPPMTKLWPGCGNWLPGDSHRRRAIGSLVARCAA